MDFLGQTSYQQCLIELEPVTTYDVTIQHLKSGVTNKLDF